MRSEDEKDKAEAQTALEKEVVAPVDAASEEDFSSELDEPMWSVVNFELVWQAV